MKAGSYQHVHCHATSTSLSEGRCTCLGRRTIAYAVAARAARLGAVPCIGGRSGIVRIPNRLLLKAGRIVHPRSHAATLVPVLFSFAGLVQYRTSHDDHLNLYGFLTLSSLPTRALLQPRFDFRPTVSDTLSLASPRTTLSPSPRSPTPRLCLNIVRHLHAFIDSNGRTTTTTTHWTLSGSTTSF